MENNSWIKLYRKIFNNPYMNKPAYLSVWIWMLTHAEHGKKIIDNKLVDKKENEMPSVLWEGKRRYLKRGEFTFGAYRISEDTGVPRGTVENIINMFKSEEQIEVQSSNKFSVGLVINWDKYQYNGEQNEELLRNNSGTTEDVTKNIKNVKKKNITTEQARNYLQRWNQVFSKAYVSTKAIESSLAFWLESYKLEEILEAVGRIKTDNFWKDKILPPEWLLRQKERGEPVDRIGRMLNNPKEDFSLGINLNNLNKK